jgi:hypothetical protein
MASLRIYPRLENEALFRCNVSKKHAKRKPRMHGEVQVITGQSAQAFMYQVTEQLHRNLYEKQCDALVVPDYKLK